MRNTSTSTSNYEPSASDGTSGLQPVQHTSDSDSEVSPLTLRSIISPDPEYDFVFHTMLMRDFALQASAERHSLDLASSHSSDEEESHRSSRKSKNIGVSTSSMAHLTSGYLPNVIEDSIAACSGSPMSRLPTVQPPSHLNVIANSQLFPNLKSYHYSPRWAGQLNDSSNIGE